MAKANFLDGNVMEEGSKPNMEIQLNMYHQSINRRRSANHQQLTHSSPSQREIIWSERANSSASTWNTWVKGVNSDKKA